MRRRSFSPVALLQAAVSTVAGWMPGTPSKAKASVAKKPAEKEAGGNVASMAAQRPQETGQVGAAAAGKKSAGAIAPTGSVSASRRLLMEAAV